jgi:hypothetical protein
MKKTTNIISIIILLITTLSCQDVVDVDLETSQERLVIEAIIKIEHGSTGNEQTVKLTKTSSFYNNESVPVNNATVVVKNISSNEEFNFVLTENGQYKTTSFVAIENASYELEVNFDNEIYKTTSTLLVSPEFIEVTQSIEEGFSDEDPEVNFIFQDFVNQEDFYRIFFIHNRPSTNEEIDDEYFIFNDNFQEDNEFEAFFESEDLITNDEITAVIYKISEQFHDYLIKLELQEDSGIGPFASPPINVKGNILNVTTEENYPYGYFSLNKIDTEVYIFE